MTYTRFPLYQYLIIISAFFAGCVEEKSSTQSIGKTVLRPPVAPPKDNPPSTPDSIRRALNCYQAQFRMQGSEIIECSLFQTGVKDVSALRDLPLIALDLGMTKVTDLSPLQGMPLERLDLESTPVDDISALAGMPLEVLKMQQTRVADFRVLKGMPLQQLNLLDLPFTNEDLREISDAPIRSLWLAGTKVTSINLLQLTDLESLDIERTGVSDIALLASSPRLLRLNIAETKISDVSPLKSLQLQRITLTPQKITAGMDVLRNMQSLQEIRTSMAEPQTAAEFWKRYDLDLYRPIDDDADPTTPDVESAPQKADSAADETNTATEAADSSPAENPDNEIR